MRGEAGVSDFFFTMNQTKNIFFFFSVFFFFFTLNPNLKYFFFFGRGEAGGRQGVIFYCTPSSRRQKLCKIILKSMHKCTSYDLDNLNL